MQGVIGQLYGTPVFVSPHALETKIKFTRKQTRKFTNTRWVKKYKKKYSYEKLIPAMFKDMIHGRIYIHPEIFEKLKQQGIL